MTKSNTKEIRDAAEQIYRWQKKIEKQLCGKKIVFVRYMTPEEAESSGWYYQPLLIFFDDGSAICAMSDDEANNAGSIGVFKGSCKTDPVLDTIPVMRERL